MDRFTILMYHMIRDPSNEQEARYACPPDRFRQHMQYLRKHGYSPTSLSEILVVLKSGQEMPNKTVAVTLDDGFEDNYSAAFPVLQEFSIPATIFISTGYVGKANDWMNRNGFPTRPMMNWEQIREMARHDVEFGGHTVTHPRLASLDNGKASSEIAQCKNEIEEKLGKTITGFAYPYGSFSDDTPGLVQDAGFEYACSTRSGFNNASRNAYVLHRIEVYGTDRLWQLKQKMQFGHNDASRLYPLKYYAGRLAARF